MKFNDMLSGAALLALALAILYTVSGYPKIPGQNIGPGAFPGLLASLLALCAVILMWRGWHARRPGDWVAFGAWMRSGPHLRGFFVTVAGLLFYILASDALGFIICAVLILCAMFWSLRVKPWQIVPLAVAATLLIHTIFYKGLRVPLPWGILLPWQW